MSEETREEISIEQRVDRALVLTKALLKGNQHTWPDDMFVYCKVQDIRNIIDALLETREEIDLNAVGARRKDA
jgi:hypothetical protein